MIELTVSGKRFYLDGDKILQGIKEKGSVFEYFE
jgi:hypothetical protein